MLNHFDSRRPSTSTVCGGNADRATRLKKSDQPHRWRGDIMLKPKRLTALLLLTLATLFTFAPAPALAQTPPPACTGRTLVWNNLVPDCLSPGESYRILFVTSGSSLAVSSEIDFYNTFVQAQADGAAGNPFSGITFNVLGSTATTAARDNTMTTGTGERIFYYQGDQVADDYADLYDGSWDSLFPRDQTGGLSPTVNFFGTRSIRVYTGSNGDGTPASAAISGGPLGPGNTRAGIADSLSFGPLFTSTFDLPANALRFYALSTVLTAPSTPTDTVAPTFNAARIDNQVYVIDGLNENLTLPAATGGDGALRYSISPTLPNFLILTGRILSGNPVGGTTMGITTYTYRAGDSDTNTADTDTDTLTFTIEFLNAGFTPMFSSTAAIPAQTYDVGTDIGNVTLPQGYGGRAPLRYSIMPTLPTGLILTGRILTGIPAAGIAQTAYTYRVDDDDANINDFSALPFTIEVTDATGIDICGRTAAVRDTILAAITPSPACTSVTAPQLAAITTLDLRNMNINTLTSGDFAGLAGLTDLLLINNGGLTTLPADIFAGLSALEQLNLFNNNLDTLPLNVFAGLTSVDELFLNSNNFASLPVGIFDGLTALANLALADNPLTPGTGLPAGIFDDVIDSLGPIMVGGSIGLSVDGTVRAAHFVCSLPQASLIEAANGDTSCLRITAAQLNTFAMTDTSLSALSISSGDMLMPDFAPGVTAYTVSVLNQVDSITVTPAASQPTATITVGGNNVDSGSPSAAIALTVDTPAAIVIVVTAPDGTTTETVTLTVTRSAVTTPTATLAGSVTEANLFAATAPTVTVTLTGADYVAAGNLMPDDFTVTDMLADGTVSITGVARTSNRIATLTLGYDRVDIPDAGGMLSVMVLAAGHTGTGDLDAGNVAITASTGTNVCGRTALVHAEIVTRSAASECTSITDLATITTLDFTQANPGGGLTAVVSGDFAGLAGLVNLRLGRNSLTTLPDDIFAGLSALVELNLFGNTLNTLRVGVFAGLTSVESLYINSNAFTSLPVGIFDDGLTSLVDLALHGNPFTAGTGLPAGIFDEVFDTLDDTVALGGGDGLAVDLVGRAAHFVCSRADANAIVTASGGDLSEDGACLLVTEAQFNAYNLADATLSGLTLTGGTLDPAFATGTTAYTVSVENSVASVTVTPTATNAADATITVNGNTVTSGNDSAAINLPTPDVAVPIDIIVTAANTTTTMTYTVTATRAAATTGVNICSRTDEVETAILAAITPSPACTSVTAMQLASITMLNLTGQSIATLLSGDFDGLTGLTELDLSGNNIDTLPADIFDGLTALETLFFFGNRGLTTLPTGIFADLTALTNLEVHDNGFTALPADIFDGLAALESLSLNFNQFTAGTGLPAGIFDDVLRGVTSVGSNGFIVDPNVRAAHFVCSRSDFAAIVTATTDVTDCIRISSAQFDTYLATIDATLSGLTLSDGALNPVFASATTTYTASVANNIASVTVTPTATNTGATITVNGATATTAIDLLTAGIAVPIAIVVTAADTTTTMTYMVTVTRATATTPVAVTLNANIAGNDVVNIAERMAGFAISGTVQTGAAVSVTIGTVGTDPARPATVTGTGTTWTVAIPVNDSEITGTSVTVTATAMLAGSPNGTATRMLTVDLTAPTATYTAPPTLTVGTAITAIMPGTPSSDISAYSVQSGVLPPGLTLDATAGGITGAPTTATTSMTPVTIRLTDTADNTADVSIIFPAVALGSQTLTGFAYSAPTAAVNLAAPIVTAPTGVVVGSLSYASGDTNICTVDPSTGVLTLVATGACVITVTASATTNYEQATDTFTITVVPSAIPVATLTGTLTEASLFASTAPTVTVTLVNTAYVGGGALALSHFTVTDTVAGTVTVSSFTNNIDTSATLTLAYSGEDITANGTLSVTLAAAGHTGADNLATATIPITASAGVNICGRTPDVRDEIVSQSSADECTSVGDLATITRLNLNSFLSTALQSDDFAGLAGLTALDLGGNSLNTLPADIFADLSSLMTLDLSSNFFTMLPANIFAGLSLLETLELHSNLQLQQLSADIFTGLSSLRTLGLGNNTGLIAGNGLPAGIFDDVLDTLEAINPSGGSPVGFFIDDNVRDAHFVCSRDDADAIVAATDGVDDCLRISSTQLNTAEADATLSGLTLSSGILAPPFATGTTTYTVSVADSVTDVTVTPTATNAGATITVNAAAVTSGSPSDVITLMAPGTPLAIPIVVTAADTTTTQTYTVTVTRVAAGSTPNFDSALPLAPQIYTVGFDVGTVTLPAATGGNAPLTYTLAPALPTGLTFDAANRQITGAPTATQPEATYTLTATDAAASDTFTFMLVVNPAVPSATLAAPTALTGANLATATVTVTLENTTYADASALGPDDFRLTATIAGTVSVRAGGVTRTSSTVATLALAHSGEAIPAGGTLSVTVLASAHDGTDALFAGRVPITVTNEDEQLEELTEELNEQVLPQVFLKLADVGSRLIADRLSAGAIVGGGTIISQAHDGEAGSSGLMAQLGQWLSGDAAEVELSRRLQNLDDFKLRDFIDGLSFAADGEQVGMAGGSLYGIGNYTRLSGDEDGVDWDGDLYSGYVGLDTRLRNGALAGVLLSYSKGEFEYVDTVGDEGEYDLDISSVNPYIGWSLSEDLDISASVGYGVGEVELNDGDGSRSSDLSVGSVSVGASGRLIVSDTLIAGGRSELRLRGDGSASQVDFDRSDAGFTDVSSHRLRLIVEASHLRSGASGSVRSGLELGVRHDGGDGQDDQGLELGGSIEWSNTRGLTLSGRTRVLTLADYDEWGVSGILRLSPGQGGRGLSFSLSPGYGRDDSGTEQLWQRGASAVSSAQTARLRMDGEVGYGLWLLGGTVQPYAGASLLQGGDSTQRMGARLALGRGVQLELEGSRHARTSVDAEHRIELQWRWSW